MTPHSNRASAIKTNLFLIKIQFFHEVYLEISFYSFLQKHVVFFFYLGFFFHNHSQITGLLVKGEGISLTPHYHSYPLQRHLDIGQAITAESSPLPRQQPDSNKEPLLSECKSLTTKLCAPACFKSLKGCKFWIDVLKQLV